MIQDIQQYLVRKNHAKSMPSRYLFLDTETKVKKEGAVEKHRMDMAWSCFVKARPQRGKDTEHWRYWASTENLWRYVEGLTLDKTSLYIFGHNIFFDLQCSDFFHYLTMWGWVLQFFYDKGMTYILVIRKGNRTIKCVSTTNYFPVSVKKLGELVGLEKQEVDFGTADRETLKEYCKRDVEIIKRSMDYWFAFIKDHDMGKFAFSRSGQAFTAFRHRFMSAKVYTHRDEEISDFERKGYYGGRVECFRFGKVKGGPFVGLDINSMYPFVMKIHSYPSRYIETEENVPDWKIHQVLKDYCVMAHIAVDTDEPVYAVYHKGKVVFPVGRFNCFVCTDGLRYALDHGHLKSIHKWNIYEKAYLFQDFVDYFYALKIQYERDGNKLMRQVVKLLLNGFYGKFAQKQDLIEEEEDITFSGYYRMDTRDMVTGETEIETKMFNKRFIVYGSKTARNSLVAISAHVTEYSRLHLWRIIKEIGLKHVLYCDTDSIKIRERDLHRVKYPIDAEKLGALKIEDRFKSLTLWGPKHYVTEKDTKIKGVPKRAKQVKPFVYEYLNFPRQATHLSAQVTRYFMAQPMTKTVKPLYDKGEVLPSGRIKPFLFGEF